MKTRKSFYRALKKIASQFKWNLNKRNELRGFDKEGRSYCPITAVYKIRTGRYRSSEYYNTAASVMGLPGREADKIAEGADGSPVQRIIRAALVRAVNPTYQANHPR